MIIKNVIKTCSCFIDRSVWFINLSQKQVVNPFYFEMSDFENGNRIVDIVENKFIKDVRETKIIIDGKIIHKNTIVISCDDCFKFQLFLI